MVAVLAFQIFSVLRTEDDEEYNIPTAPRPGPSADQLDPEPPEAPPEIPPPRPMVNVDRLSTNNPFDWRRQTGPAVSADANLRPLQLLRIRGEGPDAIVQIQTETGRKWYTVGEAFESYELLDVDADAGTAEVFDESVNRTRTIRLNE